MNLTKESAPGLKNFLRDCRSVIQSSPVIFAVLLIMLGYGIIMAFRESEWTLENVVPLSLLAALLSWNVLCASRAAGDACTASGRAAAWLLLVISPAILLFFTLWENSGVNGNLAFLFLVLALCCYRRGIRAALRVTLPAAVCMLAIPYQEYLILALSYPLRLLSTMISVESLWICGMDNISYDLTTITLGKSRIAITDACSGISQLAVMLFLGYVVVVMRHPGYRLQALIHYLLILPIIIFANSLRLIATILLYNIIGNGVFREAWHVSLGCAMVIICVILMWAVGLLFQQVPEPGKGTEK